MCVRRRECLEPGGSPATAGGEARRRGKATSSHTRSRNANASVQCPVQPGQYTVVQTVALPEEIPKAKFVVNIRGYTVDEDDLACLDLVVDFVRGPEVWRGAADDDTQVTTPA